MPLTEIDFIFNAPLLNIPSLGYDMGNSLILAPHPDDESLGCGGVISLLRSQQIPVHIAFITNGAASHVNSIQCPPTKLAMLRKTEGASAAGFMGVDGEHLYFFDQPDGQLNAIDPKAERELIERLRAIIIEKQVQTLFIPYKKDAHDDHRATWQLAMRAIEQLPTSPAIVEYPIWFWKNGVPGDIPDTSQYNFFRLDVSTVKKKKKQAILAHASQTTDLINDDPHGFMLTQALLKPFMGDFEYFFFQRKKEPTSLSKKYFDQLYTKQSDPWNFEKSSYEQSKYETTLDALTGIYDNALEIGCSIGVLTEKLALKCKHLTAVDISEIPLKHARQRCESLNNIMFEKMDIAKNFPEDSFELILISEVGYYLDRESLTTLFENCKEHLRGNGQLLMVHWTSYVSEYPLTGTEVHQYFKQSLKTKDEFTCLKTIINPAYELVLWQKTG